MTQKSPPQVACPLKKFVVTNNMQQRGLVPQSAIDRERRDVRGGFRPGRGGRQPCCAAVSRRLAPNLSRSVVRTTKAVAPRCTTFEAQRI